MSTEKNYQRTILFQTDDFEVVSIEWKENSYSAEHGHGWSQCMVLVEEGVFENRLNLGMNREVQILKAGEVIRTPVGARHEIFCKSVRGKTLHVYLPKIKDEVDGGRFRTPKTEDFEAALKLGKRD